MQQSFFCYYIPSNENLLATRLACEAMAQSSPQGVEGCNGMLYTILGFNDVAESLQQLNVGSAPS